MYKFDQRQRQSQPRGEVHHRVKSYVSCAPNILNYIGNLLLQPSFTCSKSTMETPQQCSLLTLNRRELRHGCRSDVFIVNVEKISHIVLVFHCCCWKSNFQVGEANQLNRNESKRMALDQWIHLDCYRFSKIGASGHTEGFQHFFLMICESMYILKVY